MNARKSLVKFFGPVLLLTASLALPADTMAAPGHGRQAAHAKAENHKKQNKKQNANPGQQRQRQQQARAARVRQERQRAPQRQRHQQVARQKVVKQKIVKQKAVRPRVTQQSRVRTQRQIQTQRQLELQRQRQLQLQQRQSQVRVQQQRQLALQRQAELRRQSQIQQRNTYRNRNRYHAAVPYRSGGRRGGGGADPNVFAIDGYLSDEGRECLTLRGHDGRLWSLAGGTYGLQPGEHVRLYGRIVDGGACGWQGTAYDIYEVQTVWADERHRTTYYDHLYDGPFDQLGSGDRYDDRYDDGYYDDDPYNNGADIPYRNNGGN
jgi:hypothetical protein